MPKKNKGFHCRSEAQKKAIRANYARRAAKNKYGNKRVEAPYPHFRYYRKSGHPALIVGEQKAEKSKREEYRYRKVMHSEKDGRHLNEKIEPNPDPKDENPMYIGKRIRHDDKDHFENVPLPWKYPDKNK